MAFFKSKTEKLAANLHEEQLYAQAGREVAKGDVSPGLWTKAFAQARGDEQRAKSLYIKLRVEQIRLGLGAASEVLAQAAPPKLSAPIALRRVVASEGYRMTCPKCGGTNLWERPPHFNNVTYFCGDCKTTITPRNVPKA